MEERKAIAKKAKKLLQKDGFGHLKFIEKYDILKGKFLESKDKVAVKICIGDSHQTPEEELWPKLNHPNVVDCLKMISMDCAKLYVMPRQLTPLDAILNWESFLKSSFALNTCIGWIQDVASGLGYLHGMDLCHLNLKSSHILITQGMRAAIGHFSHLSHAKDPVDRYGLEQYERPPECWMISPGVGTTVDGKQFDLWTLGMLGLSVFTGERLKTPVKEPQDWSDNVRPHLQKALKEENLSMLLQKSFPNSGISMKCLPNIQNLLQGTLRYDATKRPPTTVLKNHRLFKTEGNHLPPDELWIEEYHEEHGDEKGNEGDIRKSSDESAPTDENATVVRESEVSEINSSPEPGDVVAEEKFHENTVPEVKEEILQSPKKNAKKKEKVGLFKRIRAWFRRKKRNQA